MFPFHFNGTQHYECIEDEDSESDKVWCATEVIEDGMEMKWDYCPGNIVLTFNVINDATID